MNTPLDIKRTKKSVSTIVAADLLFSSRLDVIVLFVFFASVIFSVSPISSSSSIDLGSRTRGSRIALKGSQHPFLRRGLLLLLSDGEEEDDDEDDEAITLLPRDERFVVIKVFFFREDKEEELTEEEHADEEEDKTRRSAFANAIAVILTLYVLLYKLSLLLLLLILTCVAKKRESLVMTNSVKTLSSLCVIREQVIRERAPSLPPKKKVRDSFSSVVCVCSQKL